MPIDKINSTEPISQIQRPNYKAKVAKTEQIKDTISVSSAAKQGAELLRVRDMVAQAPDIRTDRLNEVRAKLNDPNYLNSGVIEGLADKLMEQWDI